MANSKDVVVTGVSTGIGLGTTKVLVSKGFRVFGSVRTLYIKLPRRSAP
jgi:NAD(P)-dependent dehydrogenase (short-subunit alcohol dehydrogenase family)